MKLNLNEYLSFSPVVKLANASAKMKNNIFAKLEYLNPTGSIKDVSVAQMLLTSISKLSSHAKVHDVEFVIPSSGNAGVSLAYFGEKFGVQTHIFVPNNISAIKLNMIKSFGANVTLLDHTINSCNEGGWVYQAKKYCENSSVRVLIDQFNDPQNIQAHFSRTGPDLLSYFKQENKQLDRIFFGIGTGGTAMGIGRYLKENSQNTKIIGVDPVGGLLYGEFHNQQSTYYPHKIEALSDSFIPKNVSLDIFDDVISHRDSNFAHFAKELLMIDGLFVGETAGFIYSSIQQYVIDRNIENENLCFLITDNGYRYL